MNNAIRSKISRDGTRNQDPLSLLFMMHIVYVLLIFTVGLSQDIYYMCDVRNVHKYEDIDPAEGDESLMVFSQILLTIRIISSTILTKMRNSFLAHLVILRSKWMKLFYIDHFCNYGVKKPCSSRVYGYEEEGMFSETLVSPDYVTSMFCQGECEQGKISSYCRK